MRKTLAPTMDPTSSWFLPRSTARSWLNEEDAMSWWEKKSYAFWDHCGEGTPIFVGICSPTLPLRASPRVVTQAYFFSCVLRYRVTD